MYHMLAGRPPFDGKTLSQIIAQKLSGHSPSLLDVSADVSQQSRQLVDDMLHHDPDRRLADYSRLIDRIDALTGTLQPVLHVGRPSGMATLSSVVDGIPTQPLSLPNNTPTEAVRSRRRLFKLAGVIILGTVVAVLITAQLLTNRSPVSSPRRDMVPSGWSESLFNGQTLGALPASGAWVVGKDHEGAIVIAGTEGTIRRTLFRNDLREQRPLENYRLQLFVRLHKALAVELHFGITADKSRDGPRSVLRMTPEQIVLGRRSSDRGELNSVTQTLSLAKGSDQYRVFMVERQRGHWWVFFDEELVGTVNRQAEPQLPEFRLTVEGGPAWFSDLQVEELVVSDNREN